MKILAKPLCLLLSVLFVFCCDSFFSLLQARGEVSPVRRTTNPDVRNSLNAWDWAFGAVLFHRLSVEYHSDGQLSTRQLTDGAANVTDSYTYDAFGVMLASSGSTPNNYLYTGEQHDPNVGFYYLRARYLNQSVGKFISQDLLTGIDTDPISLHRYLYASAQPVSLFDPSGLLTGTLTEQLGVQTSISVLMAKTFIGIRALLSVARPLLIIINSQIAKDLSALAFIRIFQAYNAIQQLTVAIPRLMIVRTDIGPPALLRPGDAYITGAPGIFGGTDVFGQAPRGDPTRRIGGVDTTAIRMAAIEFSRRNGRSLTSAYQNLLEVTVLHELGHLYGAAHSETALDAMIAHPDGSTFLGQRSFYDIWTGLQIGAYLNVFGQTE